MELVNRFTVGERWESLDAEAIGFHRTSPGKRFPWIAKSLHFLRYPYARVASPPNYHELHDRYHNQGRVLSLGGGSTSPNLDGWINADILPYATVDESFELIVCNSTLEHIPDYHRVIDECSRLLKRGGHFYLCVPQVCGRHHTVDYWRWTLPGLRLIMKDFDVVESGARLGPAMFLSHLLEAIVEGSVPRPIWLREACRTAVLWMTLPLRFLDKAARGSEMLQHYAHTIWVIGRKPAVLPDDQ